MKASSKGTMMSSSTKPPMMAISESLIPEELKNYSQWVTWKYLWKSDRWTKVPLNPKTGKPAKTNTSSSWGTFKEALGGMQATNADGIGFVFTEDDPYVGIDLDDCRNLDTGELSSTAISIMSQLGTYAEISPSGTGVKLIIRGTLNSTLNTRGRRLENIECYSSGRYFTITGKRIGEYASITTDQSALDAFIMDYLKPSEFKHALQSPLSEEKSHDLQHIDLKIEGAINSNPAIQRLMHGDSSGYRSQSEADFALCCFFAKLIGPIPALIESWFGKSALSHRAKWRERADYRNETIRNAITSSQLSSEAGPAWKSNQCTTKIYGDLWNARQLVDRSGKTMRHVPQWDKWLIWRENSWQTDTDGEVMRKAKDIADDLKQIAITAEYDQKILFAHARRTSMASRLEAMIKLASTEPDIPLNIESLDRDPYLLNCLNGTLNLRTGKLREHRREDWLTKLAPVEYHEDAQCPIWMSFLQKVMNHDTLLIEYLARAVGYSLSGLVDEQVVFFLHGTGANGKSVYLSGLQSVLGTGYAMQAMPELLMCKSGERHPTELADLFGKRFVVINETEADKQLAESLLKQLSGGDRLRARRMREDFWEFSPTHKLWIAGNHKPQIKGLDYGIWRRLHLIPWQVTIPSEEQDKQLCDKLRAEAPGILAWAIRGFQQWQHQGLNPPAIVREATEKYRSEQDLLGTFLEECCTKGSGFVVASSELHLQFCSWLGVGKTPSTVTFADMMKAKGYHKEKHSITGKMMWQGITLRTDDSSGHTGCG